MIDNYFYYKCINNQLFQCLFKDVCEIMPAFDHFNKFEKKIKLLQRSRDVIPNTFILMLFQNQSERFLT